MNFLFHMFLSGNDEELLVGNFMGDFVKGPLQNRFPERITQGVILHRHIDSYAEHHPLFRRSRHRISGDYGLYRGVLVDLFYDYFLANGWDELCSESLSAYIARTRKIIDNYSSTLPPEMVHFVPILFNELLPSYPSLEGIDSALKRLSRRVGRDNPLERGVSELVHHHAGLQADFREFLYDIAQYVKNEIAHFPKATDYS